MSIVASLIFVALEIRTNTESNEISIEQNYSANYLNINSALASNRDLAEVVSKAISGDSLDPVELQQFRGFVRMYLTQAFHMLRLYDQGLISEEEVVQAFRVIREYAKSDTFRREIEQISFERGRRLILEPDGFGEWLARK